MRKIIAFASLLFALPLMGFSLIGTEEAASSKTTLQLPIVMYHKISLDRPSQYSIQPWQFESDIKAIKASGFTPVFLQEVIDWVDGKAGLPDKPIVITFDDGQYNNLHFGLKIAQRHNAKIVLNPVTAFSKFSTDSGDHSNPKYSHMTWEQMREAKETGLVEFGNHSHNMHQFKPRFGIAKMASETDEEYRKNLIGDITIAQKYFEQAGVEAPNVFAYPFGKYSKESRDILINDLWFRALLTCNQWVNTIEKGKQEKLHYLARFNRDGAMTTQDLIKKIKGEK